MVVVKRRVIPIAPAAAPQPARPGPVRRVPVKNPDSLRDALRAALPPRDKWERITDGTSPTDTIKRYHDKIRNPMTAIRAKCVDCCCGQLKEVALCPSTKCALYPFRMGVNPLHKRTKARLEGGAGDDNDNDSEGGE